jgi:hypothetical protein
MLLRTSCGRRSRQELCADRRALAADKCQEGIGPPRRCCFAPCHAYRIGSVSPGKEYVEVRAQFAHTYRRLGRGCMRAVAFTSSARSSTCHWTGIARRPRRFSQWSPGAHSTPRGRPRQRHQRRPVHPRSSRRGRSPRHPRHRLGLSIHNLARWLSFPAEAVGRSAVTRALTSPRPRRLPSVPAASSCPLPTDCKSACKVHSTMIDWCHQPGSRQTGARHAPPPVARPTTRHRHAHCPCTRGHVLFR